MLLEGKKLPPDHRRADARVDRVRGGASPAGAGRRDRPDVVRARDEPDREGRPSVCPDPVDVLEMDANDPAQIESVSAEIGSRWGRLDGFLHAIAFAPQDALGGNFLHTPWESVATAIQTSAFSLEGDRGGDAAADGGARRRDRLARLRRAGRVADLRLDGRGEGRRSSRSRATSRATSVRTGVRVNTVSAGPLGRSPARGSRGSSARRRLGAAGAARVGHRATDAGRRHDRVPAVGPVATGSPARSSTSTAATTRSGTELDAPPA